MAAISEAMASPPAIDAQPWNLLTLFRRSIAEPGDRPVWLGA